MGLCPFGLVGGWVLGDSWVLGKRGDEVGCPFLGVELVLVIIYCFGWDGEWEFLVLGEVGHVVGDAKFSDFSDTLERFHVVVDAEETLEGVGEGGVGEEVLVIEELFEVGSREERGEKEIRVGAFGAFGAPFEGGVVGVLAVVGDVAGGKFRAELIPGVLHEEFGDFEFGELAERRADLEVGGDVLFDVLGEELFGRPGFAPLVIDGQVADVGVGFGTFVADGGEDLGFAEEDGLDDGETG